MKLKIKELIDNGTHNSERLEIDVLEDANMKYYLIRDTTYSSAGKLSNKWTHTHKFLTKEVKAGDKVVLYTRRGTDREEDFGEHNKRYIYYWNLDNSVWNNEGDVAVIYEINGWSSLGVNK